ADTGEPGVDDEREAAEFRDARGERQLGAQCRLVKDQCDRARSVQWLMLVSIQLHRRGEVEDLSQLVRREIVIAQEMPGHATSAIAAGSSGTAASTSAAVRISGGASRTTSGLTALTSRPRSRAAVSTAPACAAVSTSARHNPLPRLPDTNGLSIESR